MLHLTPCRLSGVCGLISNEPKQCDQANGCLPVQPLPSYLSLEMVFPSAVEWDWCLNQQHTVLSFWQPELSQETLPDGSLPMAQAAKAQYTHFALSCCDRKFVCALWSPRLTAVTQLCSPVALLTQGGRCSSTSWSATHRLHLTDGDTGQNKMGVQIY